MMPAKPAFRRRRLLIKKGLQLRYIGLIFIALILTSIVTGYTVFATGWTLFGQKLASVYPQGRLLHVLRGINMALVRNLIFVSPIIFILGLLFSHKIAGPLYRIEKTIDEIAKGSLGLKIKLRRGDELKDLAEVVNGLTENLRNSIDLSNETILKIQKELDGVRNVISSQPQNPKRIETSINSLQVKLNELNSSLNKWTTS